MRRTYVAIFAIAVLFLPDILYAQHPVEPTAQYVTTFTGTADILSATDVQSGYEVTVWLVNGNYDFVLHLSSLTFSGSGVCSTLNSVPLNEIARDVADAVVLKGVESGYPGCSTSSFTKPVRVWIEECGTRSGSGCSAEFSACGSSWIYRGYSIECPGTGGAGTIGKTGGTYSSCSGQCSSTHL
ncbi:MAG: hypothetical protein KDD67_12410 [Ignavibacteriae bacterium]|nr:hypothetical protein [Ignavibacteriota bacterium]MCB9217183.1 hypothetical protein [Ignavibacteria bacterium]